VPTKPNLLTKQQAAYQYLRRGILEGRLGPGDRIVIDHIARDLEMSAIPVREAVGQLEREALVETRPHAGAVVTDVPAQAIDEIYTLLEVLEIGACRLALPTLDDGTILAMSALATRMEQTRNVQRWTALDRAFHEAIPQAAGLGRIEEWLARTGEDWQRLRRLRLTRTTRETLLEADTEHRQYLELLRQRRLPPVEKWLRQHYRNALARYKAAG